MAGNKWIHALPESVKNNANDQVKDNWINITTTSDRHNL